MLRRNLQLALGVFALTGADVAFGQAAPAQFFVVCASNGNLPIVYFSGVLQGPATSFPSLQGGFAAYLLQHYAYKGAVGCLPAKTAVLAQNFITTRSTALQKAKRTVVDTGYTEVVGAPAAAMAALVAAPAKATATATAVSTAPTTANPAPTASSASPNAATQLSSVLSSIFGTGGASGGGAAASGAKPQAAAGGVAPAAIGTATPAGSGGSQSPFAQVSNTLTSVFGNKSGNAAAPSPTAPKSSAAGSDGGLGSGQAQNTKLVVFGCGRQNAQVACVTELANQNQKDTLLQAADVWKDTFIVDDRGDRHARTTGFFLNIDGEQRPQLDVSYGKTARFVLMFDGVPTKVQKVALRSTVGSLDVEEIVLIDPNAGAAAPQH